MGRPVYLAPEKIEALRRRKKGFFTKCQEKEKLPSVAISNTTSPGKMHCGIKKSIPHWRMALTLRLIGRRRETCRRGDELRMRGSPLR